MAIDVGLRFNDDYVGNPIGSDTGVWFWRGYFFEVESSYRVTALFGSWDSPNHERHRIGLYKADSENQVEVYKVTDLEEGDYTVKIVPRSGIRYVLPQQVNLKQEKIELFLRSEWPQKGVKISLKQKGKKVTEEKRQFIKPGEIEKITLERETLKKLRGGFTLEVALEEEGS